MMEKAKITLHIPKTDPATYVEHFRAWLTKYEEVRRSTPGEQSDHPEVIAANAGYLSTMIASYQDKLISMMMNAAVDELTKQAFALGAGRFFPEVSTVIAAPGEKASASAEPRERVQVVERDPDTLEITRTITK